MESITEIINNAVALLKEQGADQATVGLILGSGLGDYAETLENKRFVNYADIKEYPVSGVVGHKNRFVIGEKYGKTVIAMQGRFHYYEGYPQALLSLGVRTMKKLGVEKLLVTNAAGGVNMNFHAGDLMMITDHINLSGSNPLIGPNLDEFGPRFPDMTRPYDPKLIAMAETIAQEQGIAVRKGVYFACTGPTYETPHEYKYMRIVGADAVGMSTTPEVIVARHADIPVFGVSVITDVAHEDEDSDYVTDGEEIVRQADAAATKMIALFKGVIGRL